MTVSNISSEAYVPVVTKFYVEPFGVEETKIKNSNGPGCMIIMVAIPVESKKKIKIFFSGTNGLIALKLDTCHQVSNS